MSVKVHFNGESHLFPKGASFLYAPPCGPLFIHDSARKVIAAFSQFEHVVVDDNSDEPVLVFGPMVTA